MTLSTQLQGTSAEGEPFLIQETRSLSRGEFEIRVRRAVSGLVSLGVGAGSAVAILMRNDLPFLEVSLAARMLGAYAVPLNFHAAAAEIKFILCDCEASVLVVHADIYAGLPPSLQTLTMALVVPTPADLIKLYRLRVEDGAVPSTAINWNTWLAGQPVWVGDPVPATDSMLYTSGTTGNPKGVRRLAPTPEQVALNEKVRCEVYGLTPGTRTLVSGPLYHGVPNGTAIRAAQVAELVVLMGRFDPEELLRLIEVYRVDTLFLVPTMFVRLLKLDEKKKHQYDLTSLRFVLHAAAPCPIELKHRMIDWWGPLFTSSTGAPRQVQLPLQPLASGWLIQVLWDAS